MMMTLFCLTRKRHAEEAAALWGSVLPFRPEYAGRIQEILKYFQMEIQLAQKFRLNYDFFQ